MKGSTVKSRAALRAGHAVGVCRARAVVIAGCVGGLAAGWASGPASAQTAGAADASAETVIVVGKRLSEPLSSTLADISVVDQAAIRRQGAAAVSDVLSGLPGIAISRNGGPAGATSVFIRGGETRHTAVYIDGMRVDSQATGGAQWEQIPLEQIDRIEVLRGPAAAVYGSDAVTGVVQLLTRRGEGPARPTASLTLGSLGTYQAGFGLAGASDIVDYRVSATQGRSDGYDSRTAAAAGHNPDRDGWKRSSLQGRIGVQVNPDHRLDLSLLKSDLRAGYDGYTPGADDQNIHDLRTGSLQWQASWNDQATTRVRVGQTASSLETRPDFYRTATTLRDLLVQHEQHWGDHQLTGTLERRNDELSVSSSMPGFTGSRHQTGLAIGWRGDFGAHGVQVRVRQDADSEFGNKHTGSLGWGWAFVPGWKLTTSAATSFRAPTLYQRFSEYGNASLVPESGRNVEVSLRWAGSRSNASLTGWRNKVSDLIDWLYQQGTCKAVISDPVNEGCYFNVGRAQLNGWTLAGETRLAQFKLRGSLDWQDPRNLDTQKVLPRRDRRSASLGLDTRVAGWTLGSELRASASRFDDANNTSRLPGYGVVNLHASRSLGLGWAVEGRIDNLADKHYELTRTYDTGGRQAQVSLRWQMP